MSSVHRANNTTHYSLLNPHPPPSSPIADLLAIDEAMLIPAKNAEDLQVVHYENGQKYDAHHDWGVSGHPESRLVTLLLYLSDQKDLYAGMWVGCSNHNEMSQSVT